MSVGDSLDTRKVAGAIGAEVTGRHRYDTGLASAHRANGAATGQHR